MRIISEETGIGRRRLLNILEKLKAFELLTIKVSSNGTTVRLNDLALVSYDTSDSSFDTNIRLDLQAKKVGSLKPVDITSESSSSLTSNLKTVKSSASELARVNSNNFSSVLDLSSHEKEATAIQEKNSKASKVSNSEKTPTADGSASTKVKPAKAKKTKKKSTEIDPIYLEIKEIWNSFAKEHNLESLKLLPARRIELIKERLKELPEIEDWRTAIKNIANSDYHLGKNPSEWKATFDFLIRTPKGKDADRLPALLRFFENQHTAKQIIEKREKSVHFGQQDWSDTGDPF